MESMHTDIRVLRVRCFSAPVSAGHKMIHFMFVLVIFFLIIVSRQLSDQNLCHVLVFI